MSKHLFVEELTLAESGSKRSRGPLKVDASIEVSAADPDSDSDPLSIVDICQDITRLADEYRSPRLEEVADRVVVGLFEQYSQIDAIEFTIRCIQPNMRGIEMAAFGVTRRRRRPSSEPLQRRAAAKARPH